MDGEGSWPVIEGMIATAMGRLQHLTITSSYDNVRTLTAVLEQLQAARERVREADRKETGMEERIAALEAREAARKAEDERRARPAESTEVTEDDGE